MDHSFQTAPVAKISRSSFRRNCSYKTTIDSGYLYPIFCDEVLPGDTFNLDLNIFARLSTPVVPIMDDIYIETFFFYVPSRLVWENFVKMMGERDNPEDSIDYIVPQLEVPEGGFPVGSIADYFGLPVNKNIGTVNALPFRAVNLIFKEWFRDENLVDSPKILKNDGPDKWTYLDSEENEHLTYPLFRRAKRLDYFTGALPWPQKGPGVELPLGTIAPVTGNGVALGLTNGTYNFSMQTNNTATTNSALFDKTCYGVDVGVSDSGEDNVTSPNGSAIGVTSDPSKSGLIADLSDASAATINSLRQAFMLQQLLERDARGGTRYKSLILSHFGCFVPDMRLDRPEFLGGSTGMVNIHQVAQTSATDSITPQGNLAAYGIFSDSKHGFTKSFVEHGYVIGFVNVRANLSYQQGVDRMWSKKTRYDFYWPEFAHLGEQEILLKEIYAQDNDVTLDNGDNANDSIFGYQERYAEYRYKQSLVTGKLRSGINESLDVWHLSQYFENAPKLNSQFIADNPPIARALAVQNEPQFILDMYYQFNSVRPMPVHGIPGFQAHF